MLRFLKRAGFDFSSLPLLQADFLNIFRLPAPLVHSSNSAHQSLNLFLFNTFPFHSNAI
jgi:hypothetical protein